MSTSRPDLQRKLDRVASYFGLPSAQVEVLAEAPLTILVQQPSVGSAVDLAFCLTMLAGQAFRTDVIDRHLLYRGVEFDRLATILRTGCNVVPSSAPFYAADPGKALEYGGAKKVVQVFDGQKLEKTYRKVRKSEATNSLEQLRQDYPSCKEMDGEWLWFSKLPPGDFRTGTAYEIEYSFFIPGNPLDALLMVFMVGNEPKTLRSAWRELQGERGELDLNSAKPATK